MSEKTFDDIDPVRKGEWMQTASGGRFFPLDVRPEDFNIYDLTNGMALDCRYGGQGRIDRFYSVAEHCTHLAMHAANHLKWPPKAVLATLLHDAPEGLLRDLPRAVKHSVGAGYKTLETALHDAILLKYNIVDVWFEYADRIKDLDQRIVPLEKKAVHPRACEWSYDVFHPLPGVTIQCWAPMVAKTQALRVYQWVCDQTGMTPEPYTEEAIETWIKEKRQ